MVYRLDVYMCMQPLSLAFLILILSTLACLKRV